MVRQRFPSDEDRYTVSFPPGLKERIKESAKVNNRTMNAEIIARLEESFEPVAAPEAADLRGLLDIAFFRVNPVFVCFRHAVGDGNVGKYASRDLRGNIFEQWQKKLVKEGIGSADEIDLEEMGLEISATVYLTSDGVNWILERSEIVTVGRLSGDMILDGEKSTFQAKALAEDAFFADVQRYLGEFMNDFNGGEVDVTNGHMLDWPRELLKRLSPPLNVHYLSPHPLPKGGLFRR